MNLEVRACAECFLARVRSVCEKGLISYCAPRHQQSTEALIVLTERDTLSGVALMDILKALSYIKVKLLCYDLAEQDASALSAIYTGRLLSLKQYLDDVIECHALSAEARKPLRDRLVRAFADRLGVQILLRATASMEFASETLMTVVQGGQLSAPRSNPFLREDGAVSLVRECRPLSSILEQDLVKFAELRDLRVRLPARKSDILSVFYDFVSRTQDSFPSSCANVRSVVNKTRVQGTHLRVCAICNFTGVGPRKPEKWLEEVPADDRLCLECEAFWPSKIEPLCIREWVNDTVTEVRQK